MFYKELIKNLEKVKTQKDFIKLRIDLSRKYKLKKNPKTIEILCHLNENQIKKFKHLITTKPTRTISGVAPIAIMTKPFSCPPQAKCIYCPGGPGSHYGDTPKSYPGGSPAHRRAERNLYDPYLQVFNRLEHYSLLNQDYSKTELIILGGTFPNYPKEYKTEFVTYAFKAMNDFSDLFFTPKFNIKKFKEFFELPSEVFNKERTKRIHEKLLKIKGKSTLEKEQKRNEISKIRSVAFCLETRVDCANPSQIDEMLKLGCTRVEVGIQSIYDNILKKIQRGNLNNANILSTQLLKDSFLKVGYHIMLGLPGSTKESDIKMFKELFSNQDFKPDALKIYPCMIFKGTKLYDAFLKKEFTPIDAQEALERIIKIKPHIASYCRIMRIQRDIPTYMVEAGVEKTNLRQETHKELEKNKIKCKCIRCREPKDKQIDWKSVKLKRFDYEASKGKEIFLSYEDTKNDLLLGFIRLRKPYKPFRKEITKDSVGIREIHVYGPAVKIGEKTKKELQHKGLGKKLLQEAEKIAKEELNAKKILIISGIGVREYFKKFGYSKEGPYMSKKLMSSKNIETS